MKLSTVAKTISALSYFFIMLQGDMIAVPFGMWLVLALFDFTSIGPLFAMLAFLGGILACRTKRQDRFYMTRILAAFLLLLSPLVWRLVSVPLELFYYTAFLLPLALFISCYLLSWVLDASKPALKPERF